MTMQFPAPSETFAAVEVRALHERGIEVDVYGLRPEHPRHSAMMRERRVEHVRTRHMTILRVMRGLLDGILAPRRLLFLLTHILLRVHSTRERLKSLVLVPIVLRIDAEVRRGRYDVVHLFWGHYPALVGAVLQHCAPCPPVSLFLGAYDLHRNYGPSALVAGTAAHVWTHAAVNLRAIEALGIERERVRVVYRGVDLSSIDEVRRRSGCRTPGHIVTAGRLIASKGTERVLRAFALLCERAPHAKLTVLGDGPDRLALEGIATKLCLSGTVRFAGHVSHDDVIASLAGAEAFVLLSSKPDERLPNAVKEAMACGVVCVVSRTPGIEELIEHGRSGFVVDVGDTVATAEALATVLAGGPQIDEIREQARRHVEQRFAASASAMMLGDAWATSVAERRG